MLVVWAHERPATAVVAGADVSQHYSVATGSGDSAGVRDFGSRDSQAAPKAGPQSVVRIPRSGGTLIDAVLDMSEPDSLVLLGIGLLSIVGIRRRLPGYLRHRQIKLRSAWQVVSGFF